jgi:hypothetical protein
MSDSVLLVSVSDLTSRLKLLDGLRVEDNKAFFESVEAALAAAKVLLASVEKTLCMVEDKIDLSNASTPEPMELSLSDVSNVSFSDVSVNLSVDSSATLVEEMDKASEKVKFVMAVEAVAESSSPEQKEVAMEKSRKTDD